MCHFPAIIIHPINIPTTFWIHRM